MTDITITKDVNVDKKLDSSCGQCKRNTKHIVLSDVHLNGFESYNHIQWTNQYEIIQCMGCETIVFRKLHENSEEYDYCYDPDGQEHIVLVETIDIFPSPEQGRLPLAEPFLIPKQLQSIYRETISALNVNHAILTGIGIRAIVETICKDQKAEGKDLFNKINGLVKQGVLTQDGADILHKLRTLGNNAAHEVKQHDKAQLSLALDVIEHLIKGVYILPHHAKSTFE